MARSNVTTAAQLLVLRDPPNRHELVRGELHTMTPAGYWHGMSAGRVGRILGNFVEEHELGEVFGSETGFVLQQDPDTVLAPDAAFVRTERLPRRPGRGFFVGPPDLAVEVLSPDDHRPAVLRKVASWLRYGTRSVWVVDARRRRVAVHGADGSVRTFANVERLRDPVLPGFRAPVQSLFPRVD